MIMTLNAKNTSDAEAVLGREILKLLRKPGIAAVAVTFDASPDAFGNQRLRLVPVAQSRLDQSQRHGEP